MPASIDNALPSPHNVAVIGLGKIGLPLAIQYARRGYRVIGCDINARIVEDLNNGKSHVSEEAEIPMELSIFLLEGLFSATVHTTDAVRQADVVVIIVPVVIDARHEVDFSMLDAATTAVGASLRPGTLVIYETTLPVGTTSQHLRILLERASGLRAGRDFSLAYSPERVSSGSIFRDLRTYPKVVGGIDEKSLIHASEFYRSVLEAKIITMSSTEEAEFVKLIETTYRDVNIALANEYAQYADTHGLDVYAAIAAANTQPYSHIHTPGVGVGGHCIPVYPYFLFANPFDDARRANSTAQLALPRTARCVNDSMAEYAVQRLEEVVGSLFRTSILILGIAYRGDVRETAFTSARLLQEALLQREAMVYVDDPLFSDSELRALGYTPLSSAYEAEVDAIIFQCDHHSYQQFDFGRFKKCSVVFDGRHALPRETIEALGMHYIAIGDSVQPESMIPEYSLATRDVRGGE
jgi:nucleotide sugar dehydrogenase